MYNKSLSSALNSLSAICDLQGLPYPELTIGHKTHRQLIKELYPYGEPTKSFSSIYGIKLNVVNDDIHN